MQSSTDPIAVLTALSQEHPELAGPLTSCVQAFRRQTEWMRNLESLLEISAHLNATHSYEELLPNILQRACDLLDAEASSLFLIDPQTGDLVMEMATNFPAEKARTIRVASGQGIVGKVVAGGRTLLVPDVHADPHFHKQTDDVTHFVTRSILCAPLCTHEVMLGGDGHEVLPGHIIGVVEVLNKRLGTFSGDDVRVFEALATQAAVALETSRLYEELRSSFMGVVSALAESIDAKDDDTHGHSSRVATLSVAIGKSMNLSSRQLVQLRLCALLHDIGKIGVPDEVLRKAGPLNEGEVGIIREHTRVGYRIVSQVPALQESARAMLEHHEWFNGTGYPQGLSGTDISLFARIIGVADAFDAMISFRVYRSPLPLAEAMQRLRNGAGIQFDPGVVNAFELAIQYGVIQQVLPVQPVQVPLVEEENSENAQRVR